MSTALAHPITIQDLGKQLARYRSSLPPSAKSGVRIRASGNRISLTIAKSSGLRVFVDSKMASLLGGRLPKLAVGVQRFETTTEASSDATRLVFAPKPREAGSHRKSGLSSLKDEFGERVRRFFDTAVVSQLHHAALKAALNAPTEFDTILRALERPEIAAAVRDRDPLAMARLRGIEVKRRILSEDGGMLSAEKVGEVLTVSRQAVEKRRKAGRLIGVSLGRRGFGYPAWQFSERGTLAGLEAVLDALKPHDAWTKLVFFTSENAATNGKKPLDLLRSGDVEKVLVAARTYGEQGAL
ncbi:MAG TPA: hypothetical protein VME43_33705 [Bryobacteraceae bacterium]|nr:hypothetical protein [Bryobacteraceae bacterium]